MGKQLDKRKNYLRLMEIKSRIEKGEATSFQERQALMIFENRLKKKKDET